MSNQSEPLSRRDQLAAAAMQGLIIANANAGKQASSFQIALSAVQHADSLMVALSLKKQA